MYGVELYAAVRLAVVDEGLSLLQGTPVPFGGDCWLWERLAGKA